MDVRTVARQAIDCYLSVVKFPLDLVAQRVGPVASGRTDAQLTVDRIDAEFRDLVGRLLLDDEFREDAARRRAAASAPSHIGRVRVATGGVEPAPDDVESAPNDLENLRRREDRSTDLEVEETSLGDRAAAQLAEQELAQLTEAAEKAKRRS